MSARPLAAERLPSLVGPQLAATTDRSLLLYIHVPFCSSKCTFCDWVSDIPVAQLRAGAPTRSDYTAAVCAQIQALGPVLSNLGYEPGHIYWGGGTPSMLSSAELEAVVHALESSFDLSRVDEHTIETSPETLTAAKLRTLRRLGVNRISMGVQSFDDRELRRAARAHSAAMAIAGAALIADAGFANVNLDLIVGSPEQPIEMLDRTLATTIEIAPAHLTVYLYRAEPKTVMAKQIRQGHRAGRSVTDTLEAYEYTRRTLEQAGYREYTVGYFTKSAEYRFKGEEYYFGLGGDYIGFGCGGESILGHHRLVNPSHRLQQFIERPAEFFLVERFSPSRLDGILRALRLTVLTEGGIEYRRFERVFGFPFSSIRNHPHVKGLLQYLRFCGAEFVETSDRLSVTPESRSRSYIVALQRAFSGTKGHAQASAGSPPAAPVC